jgi:hypothetical protein
MKENCKQMHTQSKHNNQQRRGENKFRLYKLLQQQMKFKNKFETNKNMKKKKKLINLSKDLASKTIKQYNDLKKVEMKKKDIYKNGMIIQQWVMKLINIMNCPNEHHTKS